MAFDTPEQTSVNQQEFQPEPYVIAFAPELIGFIVSDQKVTTYRYGDKYDYLQIGDNVAMQNSATTEIAARARITDKRRATFADLPVASGRHEMYRDKEHQRAVLSGYYAYLGRPLADDDPFLVFEFEQVSAG